MKEVYIHVGYPKCASSFLQRNVFPYLKNVNFIYNRVENKYGILYPHFVSLCELYEGKNLISCEQLTGNSFVHNKYCNGFEIAERLKRLYHNAGIIIIRRNKDLWLRSLYKQFCSDARRAKCVSGYQDWYDNHLDHNLLRFDEYEKKVRELFDEVLVIRFEEFCRDNDKGIEKICDFIGVDFPYDYDRSRRNVALNNNQLKFIRLSGKIGVYKFTNKYMLGFFRRMNRK